jgi:hypothetical protein
MVKITERKLYPADAKRGMLLTASNDMQWVGVYVLVDRPIMNDNSMSFNMNLMEVETGQMHYAYPVGVHTELTAIEIDLEQKPGIIESIDSLLAHKDRLTNAMTDALKNYRAREARGDIMHLLEQLTSRVDSMSRCEEDSSALREVESCLNNILKSTDK